MVATFTRGTTYSTGSQVTSANLATLVESATLGGVDRSNIDDTTGQVITTATDPPIDLATLEPWQQEDQLWPVTKLSSSDVAPVLPQAVTCSVDAASGNILAGDVLEIVGFSSGRSVVKLHTGDSWRVLGNAAHDAVALGQVVCILHGLVRMRVGSAIAVGEMVQPDTAGVVERVDAPGSGDGLLGLGVALKAAATGFVWVNRRR